MTEEAERSPDIFESFGGIKFSENIIVFVERSSMTESDVVVDDNRTF